MEKLAQAGKTWASRPHHGGATPPWTKGQGTETLTRSLMSTSMFTSTECPSTELTFVLFIRNVLRLRRFGHGCDRRCGSCSSSRHCKTMIESLTRNPRVKGKRLSDSEANISMDWTYAKRNSFDHAFWYSSSIIVAGGESSLGGWGKCCLGC